MNDTEREVLRFLVHKSYRENELVYEPDGNVPPDFLLQDRIAIEVRRLNQNYEGLRRAEGLEEAAIPLLQGMTNLVKSFGPPTAGHSWFVSYDFSRPIVPWRTLKPKVKTLLSDFVLAPEATPTVHTIEPSFRIEIAPSSLAFDTYFVIGGYMDTQAGGWVLSEMIRNIEIAVTEKTTKVAAYRTKYAEWWLALVNRIGVGLLDASDIAEIRKLAPAAPEWNKVLIIDPADHARSFEL